ncbi:hypothetical protein P7M40_24850, partial [Vibrio parahaemolyticus]|nr:hypothetical protein [Vibrio parahaemolyticus]
PTHLKKNTLIIFCIISYRFLPHREGEENSRPKLSGKQLRLLMVLVGSIALLSDLTLCASERVVLREQSNGSRKLLEEIVLALGHFLHIRLGPLVIG